MQIFINALDGQVHRLEVNPETTVAQIKKQLEADDHILSYGSAILADSQSLLSLDLTEGATLAINARLLGGKVHGSLARAGKVRAQTPKVDKQEKKKKKKGRAARRIQYTKRFVNVATGPGKKRGPNSNQA
ncbi:Ribosomal protein S30 [Parelaphostrongylus tenuis]|uniref:Ribosomal protein S30 n=1 Tax=Parelaphostrongylus tenuis TaxID=148309 RepID=A0AAD5M7E6_PARTN|nr:Ribosomal protein S30 [Parelaphostrongylus tenuis]